MKSREQGGRDPAVQCVWVLSGSPEPSIPSSFDWIPRPDRVVVADGGSSLIGVLGVTPDIVLGDFDSIEPPLLAQLESMPGLDIRKYEHHRKLETDTELAVLAALEWEPRQVVIFGAIGGRLDHAVANVFLLGHPALRGRDVRIVEGDQEAFLAQPGRWTLLHGRPGDTASMLPFEGQAIGVKNRGLEYPLSGETISFGTSRGVSNVLQSEDAAVWLDAGLLLVVVDHAPQNH